MRDKGLNVKFKVLNHIITIFNASKKVGDNELAKSIARVKQEFLITKIGCSEEVADSYIKAALDRMS